MKISHPDGEKTIELEEEKTVEEVLDLAGINKETVIVRRGDEVIPDDEKVTDDDELRAIKVISGG